MKNLFVNAFVWLGFLSGFAACLNNLQLHPTEVISRGNLQPDVIHLKTSAYINNEIKQGNFKVLYERQQNLMVNVLQKHDPKLVKLRTNTRLVDTNCWEHGISLAGKKLFLIKAAEGESETNKWGHGLTELCLENLILSLQMLSFTITGWENRIVPLLISWLIRSLHRNRRKLEFSFKKNTARSRQKLRLQSTSFKIQASSQMQPANIQPPRNHLEHITKGDN